MARPGAHGTSQANVELSDAGIVWSENPLTTWTLQHTSVMNADVCVDGQQGVTVQSGRNKCFTLISTRCGHESSFSGDTEANLRDGPHTLDLSPDGSKASLLGT